MALKFVRDNLDGLDEATAKFYEKNADDGKFYLMVEGAVAKSRLDEFRDKNVELSRTLETFKGVDPKEYATLKTQVVELKTQLESKGNKLTDEEINTLLQDRTKSMREEYEGKLTQANEQTGTLSRQLESMVIDSAVRTAATSSDIAKTALDDVVMRAKGIFKMKDGVAMPYDSKGQIIYGKNGADPMTPQEWIKGLKNDAPHLFAQPKGGGAGGGGTGKGGGQNRDTMSPLAKVAAGLSERAAS